jgi:hypothetical protein
MSRGHGVAERFVLDELARLKAQPDSKPESFWFVHYLAEQRWGQDPTEAQVKSLRRAVHNLARKELVETQFGTSERRVPNTNYLRHWECPHDHPAPDGRFYRFETEPACCDDAKLEHHVERSVVRRELCVRLPIEPHERAGVEKRRKELERRMKEFVREFAGMSR